MKKLYTIVLSVMLVSMTACGTVAKGPDAGTPIFNPTIIDQASKQNSALVVQNTDTDDKNDVTAYVPDDTNASGGEDQTGQGGEDQNGQGGNGQIPNTYNPQDVTEYDPMQGSFYKEATPNDVATADDGTQYIKNQILISTEPGTADDLMAALSEEYNFTIVGKLTFTGDYQIEFQEEKTYEELRALIAEFKQLDWVKYCSLNVGIPKY